MILSVLIPTLKERVDTFKILLAKLKKLSLPYDIEILWDSDNRENSIGFKRNRLIDRATGDYSVFIDDDDDIPEWYFEDIINALKENPDCIGFKGSLVWLNTNKSSEIFRHSINLPFSKGLVNGEYLRPPNHLNPIRTSFIRQLKFPDKSFGEDYDFCIKLAESKLLQKEIFLDKIMYYYLFNKDK